MSTSNQSKTVTADNEQDLNLIVKDMVEQGWQTDGSVIKNTDGTVSQRLVR